MNLICKLWGHDDPLWEEYLEVTSETTFGEINAQLEVLDSTPRKCERCGEELSTN